MAQQSDIIFNLKTEIEKYGVSNNTFTNNNNIINGKIDNLEQQNNKIQSEFNNFKTSVNNTINNKVDNDDINVALDIIKITSEQNNTLKDIYNNTDGQMESMMNFEDLSNHLLENYDIDLKGNMGIDEPILTGNRGEFYLCPILLCDNERYELTNWRVNIAIADKIYPASKSSIDGYNGAVVLSNGLAHYRNNNYPKAGNFGVQMNLVEGSYIVFAQTLYPKNHNYMKATCFKRVIVE